MVKSISHGALDAAFAYIAGRADTLALCAGAPLTAEEALTSPGEGGTVLAMAAMVPGLGNGDFAIMPGVVSGGRLVIGGRDGMPVIASGLADHMALLSEVAGELLLVTALSEDCELVEGGTAAVGEFSFGIADPD